MIGLSLNRIGAVTSLIRPNRMLGRGAPFGRRVCWATVAAALALGHAAPAQQSVTRPPPPPTPAPAKPTPPDSEPLIRLSLSQYVAAVGQRNLEYAAQAFNVPIADAQLSVAHLYPNPTISGGVGIAGKQQPTSYDLSLTQTILLGGKRGARTDVARDQLAAAKAQLDDFLRTLRGTAATAYLDALHAEQSYLRKRRTSDDLDRLVVLNQRRVAAGDIGEIDLVQSRVDAAQFHAQLVAAANEVRASRLTLAALLGPQRTDTLVAPAAPLELSPPAGGAPDLPMKGQNGACPNGARECSARDTAEFGLQLPPAGHAEATGAGGPPSQLPVTALPSSTAGDTLLGGLRAPPTRGPQVISPPPPGAPRAVVSVAPPLDVDSLVRAAVASRPDVIAAQRLRDASIAGIHLAHDDRWSDVDLTIGTSYFTPGTNFIDPTPQYGGLNFGISLPIMLSDFTHGEVAAAEYTAKQSDKTLQSVVWKAALDVRQAWAGYQAAVAQLDQYTSGVLLDAERVRRAKLYSYQHGSASLLDVLTAEQTANDVFLASYDAQQQYGHALIGLGQATGTWSIVYATDVPPPK